MSHSNLRLARVGLLFGLAVLGGCTGLHREQVTRTDAAESSARADHERAFARLAALEGELAVGSLARPSATVVMRAIARGSALLEEWIWPNGARELTVFFLDNGTLRATHYCHSGVQSTMALLDPASSDELVFRITSATNLPSPEVNHNTGFACVFAGDGVVRRLEQWTENGRVSNSEVTLVRRRSAR